MRGDYFREWTASRDGDAPARLLWPTDWVASGTATVAFQPAPGFSLRAEYRHDHAADAVHFGGTVAGDGDTMPYVPNRRAQDTVTIGATAWF